MTKAEAEKIVTEYLSAINSNDVERIMALYAETCSVEDPVGSELKHGYQAVQKFYTNIQDLNIKAHSAGPVRVTDQGNALAFPFQIAVKVDDAVFVQDIIDVFYCDASNKIERMQAFWGSENAQME